MPKFRTVAPNILGPQEGSCVTLPFWHLELFELSPRVLENIRAPPATGISGVPKNFVQGGGVQQIQLRTEDKENGDLVGGSPLVRGSGGSCNLVQEISFHIVISS